MREKIILREEFSSRYGSEHPSAIDVMTAVAIN